MRKTHHMLAIAAALALAASHAHAAAGVNVRWNACFGDGGLASRSFACNTNVGSQALVASFVVGAPVSQVGGVEVDLDVAVAGATLPAWWQFVNSGSCRLGSAGANQIIPASAVACTDWGQGQSAIGIASYTVGSPALNTARFVIGRQVPATNYADLSAGVEYFDGNLTINNAKTVGTSSCSGCSAAACLAINKVVLYQISGSTATPVATLTGPSNGTDSNFVTWQGGAGAGGLPTGECPLAVPVRRKAWSDIKTLYR
jgi:hypothetical protein